jgi:hypothetical protein
MHFYNVVKDNKIIDKKNHQQKAQNERKPYREYTKNKKLLGQTRLGK